MDDTINEIINQAIKELQDKKNKLLLHRISKKVKIDDFVDITEESKRMFPRLKCVYHSFEHSEHWYWNDGSVDGLHLISFYPDNNFDENSDVPKVQAGFKYSLD